MELLPEPLEEALGAEADQMDRSRGAAHLEALARLNRRAHLAVERDEHLITPGRDRLDRHDRVCRQDKRPDGEGVRADRRHDDGIDGRHDDRSAGRHRVRRRAGGRADDDPVGRVLRDFIPVDRDFEPHDARDAALVHHNVIEDERLLDSTRLRALPHDRRLQRESWLGGIGLPRDRIERPVERVRTCSRQESDATQVQTEDRRVGPVQEPGASEQSAVAAKRDQTIEFGLERFAERRRSPAVARRPERLNALLGVELQSVARRLLLERPEKGAEIRIVGVPDDPDVHRGG